MKPGETGPRRACIPPDGIKLRSVLEILGGNVCQVVGLYSPPRKVIVGILAHSLSPPQPTPELPPLLKEGEKKKED